MPVAAGMAKLLWMDGKLENPQWARLEGRSFWLVDLVLKGNQPCLKPGGAQGGFLHSKGAVLVVCSGRRGASWMALPVSEHHRAGQQDQRGGHAGDAEPAQVPASQGQWCLLDMAAKFLGTALSCRHKGRWQKKTERELLLATEEFGL